MLKNLFLSTTLAAAFVLAGCSEGESYEQFAGKNDRLGVESICDDGESGYKRYYARSAFSQNGSLKTTIEVLIAGNMIYVKVKEGGKHYLRKVGLFGGGSYKELLTLGDIQEVHRAFLDEAPNLMNALDRRASRQTDCYSINHVPGW